MAARVSVASTSPQDWRYIAEGGATMVFGYVGPAHPVFDGTALRLRKTVHGVRDVDPEESSQGQDGEGPDDPSVVFQNAVIARLVSREYLPRLEHVLVEKTWLEELDRISDERRPPKRRAVDKIDVTRKKAVLADNLIGGDGLVVEIKPKWGFLPSPAYLSPATRDVKTRVCRFCMHSHPAVSEKQDIKGSFCPLDLYSGETNRVVCALGALWDAWLLSSGGINNLRIFVEGEIVRPNPDKLISESTPAGANVADLRRRFVSLTVPAILDSSSLQLLSTLQRTLDPFDIEGLVTLWTRIHTLTDDNTTRQFGSGVPEPTIEEWSRFIDSYLAKSHLPSANELAKAAPDELRYHTLAYLLSATFKDCSLMIRLPCATALATHNHIPDASIYLIDLDVKSISRLAKWKQLDRYIVESYMQTGDTRRCVDARKGL
ncbi:hypothetical protein CERSUDRAFT_152861 [Gelatoporia subvermispora B]|uniref:Inositol-pentakisphosphate 2-kinase n=1 Tax=Ceriporiopsis subvermispora (strain B) TaxID=914234 RepID=M2R0Y1_CERS8|nr:hypothetical protein CERSUDRAFT_152861 [Gelatoporia subvermispora B]